MQMVRKKPTPIPTVTRRAPLLMWGTVSAKTCRSLGDGDGKTQRKTEYEDHRELFALCKSSTDLIAYRYHGSLCSQREKPHAEDYHDRSYEEIEHKICLNRAYTEAQQSNDQDDRKDRYRRSFTFSATCSFVS